MMEPSLLQFYVSRQWLNKFKTFAEPGPISNNDFLCMHGGETVTEYHLSVALSLYRDVRLFKRHLNIVSSYYNFLGKLEL